MDTAIFSTIKKLYGYKKVTLVREIKAGFLSHNFVIRADNQQLFLKEYRSVLNETDLRRAHAAKAFFAERNISVITPINSLTKKTYFKHKNNYYALFPLIKGRVIKKGDPIPTPAIIAIARNLALMHKLSAKQYPQITKTRLPEWDLKQIISSKGWFTTTANQIVDLIQAKRTKTKFDTIALETLQLKLKLGNQIGNNLKVGYLGKDHISHGDYHAQNLFFDKEYNVTHVFDFEKSEIRPRSLELVRSMFLICFDSNFKKENFTKARLYIKTYNSIYPIPPHEISAAITFMHHKSILSLWIEQEHYLLKNKRVDLFLESNLKSLRYLSRHMQEFIKKLTE